MRAVAVKGSWTTLQDWRTTKEKNKNIPGDQSAFTPDQESQMKSWL